MKETMRMTVMSIAFLWIGLTVTPGAGPTSEIVKIGLIGTAAALVGFGLVAYIKRDQAGSVTRRQD